MVIPPQRRHANIIIVKRYLTIPVLLLIILVVTMISVYGFAEYYHDTAEKPISPILVPRGAITASGAQVAYNSSSITKRLWGPEALLSQKCDASLERLLQMDCDDIKVTPKIFTKTPYAWVEFRERRITNPNTSHILGRSSAGGNSGLENALNFVLDSRYVFSGTVPQVKVETTLDPGMQKITDDYVRQISEELAPERAWIVVISNTGDILAASAYTKDSKASSPLYQEVFEPGSIFKPLVMAWALQTKSIDTSFTVNSPGVTEIDGTIIKDWKPLGEVDLFRALQQSSNIYMANVARKMGYDTLISGLKAYKLDQPMFGLREEAKAIMPEDSKPSLLNAGFGQGVAVTPLQLLRAYTAIANDGLLCDLRLIKAVYVDEKKLPLENTASSQVLDPSVASLVRRIMTTIATPTVSAAAVPHQGKYFSVAAKSGTAQVAVNGKYNDADRLYSYVGIMPANQPQMIMLISIDRPANHAPSLAVYVAAPWFRLVARDLMLYKGIRP